MVTRRCKIDRPNHWRVIIISLPWFYGNIGSQTRVVKCWAWPSGLRPLHAPLQWISSPRLRTRTGRLFGLLARSIPASVKEGKTRHDQPFPISHPWHGTSTVASFSYGACFSARCPLVTRRAFPDEFSAYGDFESIPCPSGGQGFYNICYSHRFLFLFRFLW